MVPLQKINKILTGGRRLPSLIHCVNKKSKVGMSRVDVDPPGINVPRLRRPGCVSYETWKSLKNTISTLPKAKCSRGA